MSVGSRRDVLALVAAGRVVAEALARMRALVRPGRGFRVLRELGGHGIGRTIHEPPSVPNFGTPATGVPLTEGLVITIEPIVAAATRSTRAAAP